MLRRERRLSRARESERAAAETAAAPRRAAGGPPPPAKALADGERGWLRACGAGEPARGHASFGRRRRRTPSAATVREPRSMPATALVAAWADDDGRRPRPWRAAAASTAIVVEQSERVVADPAACARPSRNEVDEARGDDLRRELAAAAAWSPPRWRPPIRGSAGWSAAVGTRAVAGPREDASRAAAAAARAVRSAARTPPQTRRALAPRKPGMSKSSTVAARARRSAAASPRRIAAGGARPAP